MLETHMKLCVAGPDFPEKFFLPQKLEKWAKNRQKQGFFLIHGKILSLSFTEFVL